MDYSCFTKGHNRILSHWSILVHPTVLIGVSRLFQQAQLRAVPENNVQGDEIVLIC